MTIALEGENIHPNLFYDRVWVQKFQNHLKENKIIYDQWQTFVDEADQLLEVEFVDEAEADEVDTQHGNYNKPSEQISSMGMRLGLVYQVTGEKKYATKLREGLLHYASYQKWYGKGLRHRNPPWQSELNTARFCQGFAVGYDALYSFLTEEERSIIREGVIRLGILPILEDWIFPETRIHAMDSMGHNWWSVCVSQAGLAVISMIDDEPKAREWLKQILDAFPHYFHYKGSVLGLKSPNYDDKGAFYESVGYGVYGLGEYLQFRLAYHRFINCFDVSDIPLLNRVGDFFIQTFYPSSEHHMTVNFGDSSIRGNAAMAARLLLAIQIESPQLRWYLQKYELPFTPIDFIYYEQIYEGEIAPPQDKSELYEEVGWAVIRDSWEDNSTLLAVKSGFTWNHAHADAGSFVLFHQGKALIMDSGNCSYDHPKYAEYFQRSHAHNVILFEGEGQPAHHNMRGVKEPGHVYHLLEQEEFRYVYADATGPMSPYVDKHFRHFLWMDHMILIIDDILAHHPGTVQWLLHPGGDVQRTDHGDFRIKDGDAQLTMRPLFPRKLTVTKEKGWAEHDPEYAMPYYSFAAKSESKETKFMTALILGDDLNTCVPEITELEDEWMTGVRIRYQDQLTDVYFNHRADGRVMHSNGIQTLGNWETDAYLLAVTRPVGSKENEASSLERWFIANGSYVRNEDIVLFHSLSKATAIVHYHADDLEISIVGQPQINGEVYVKDQPKHVKVNGSSQEVIYDPDIKRVTFQAQSKRGKRRPG